LVIINNYIMNAHEDAVTIRNAIKGLGTDDAKLVEVITRRSNEQLVAVTADYVASFGKSIFEDIKGDTSGHYRELLISLVEAKPAYIARIIHNAVKGAGTDEGALIDALVHTPNALIKASEEAYHKLFHKNIMDDVAGDLSGDFKRFLVGILAGARDESGTVNQGLVVSDADNLYAAGEGKIGTDESVFVEFFLQRSYLHIVEVSRIYREKRGHDLVAAINSEFSGNLRRALKAAATPRHEYWAGRIHQSLSGLGTNDQALIRAFVLNSREQLKYIEAAYQQRIARKHSGEKKPQSSKGRKEPVKQKEAPKKIFTGTLQSDIKGDTSGWYEKALLSLLN